MPNRVYLFYRKTVFFSFSSEKWIRFVNRSDWVPTQHSVLCKLHFEDIYKNRGKRMSWSMKPVSTIHSAELIDMPSALPTTQTFRLDSFCIHDKTNSLDDWNRSHSLPGFEFQQFEGCVIF